MLSVKLKVKGSSGGKLIVRKTAFGEIGIYEGEPVGMSVYWDAEDTDKVIKALEKVKKEVL